MDSEQLIIPTAIIRSKRKSLSLIIKNNGDFIVRAPLKYKEDLIYSFISKKKDWIIKKRQEQANNSHDKITFDKAENISILGREYPILLTNTKKAKLSESALELPNQNAKDHLIKFLKSYAKKYITQRVELIASLFNMQYSAISISSAKTNWGSCSQHNRLHFTYKLIMCPEDVVDYIVLHELCHTKVKNHSAKFWALVEHCCPLYKAQEKWLKRNRMIIEKI